MSANVPSAHEGRYTGIWKKGVPNGMSTIANPRYSRMTPMNAMNNAPR